MIPVPGYWAGDGKTEMGVYCNGVWFLDSTGTNKYDGTYSYWGWSSPSSPLIPVAGNWSDSGTKDQFAVYNKGVWFRDLDGTHTWDAANQAAVAYLGWSGAKPVVGDWIGSTRAAAVRGGAMPSGAAAPAPVGLQTPLTVTLAGASQAGATSSLLDATLQAQIVAAGLTGDVQERREGDQAAPDASSPAACLAMGGLFADEGPLSQSANAATINPLAVDRIDLAGVVLSALRRVPR